MALKATIFKAQLQIADMDRHFYGDHALTLARHPSETDERMMVRLLALALHLPASTDQGTLELAKSLWDVDEPDLWQRDLTNQIVHWIDVGQPDERRLSKASPRSERVSVISFSHSTPVWWRDIEPKLSRLNNLSVWQLEADSSQRLAALAQRSMKLQITVQDGSIWVGDESRSEELRLNALMRPRET